MTMLEELHEQASAVERLVATREGLSGLAALATGCTHVVVAARGTSDNVARYAKYVWGARNRMTVALAAPSLFGPLASPPHLDDALVVGVSQSGRSPDLVAVLAHANARGRPTVAITNDPDSPLAAEADLVVDLVAGPERAVAATKSYTTSLVAVAMVSTTLGSPDASRDGVSDDHDPLPALPGQLRRALDLVSEVDLADVVAPVVAAGRCVVVGRGFHLATAFEWALKQQELAYVVAQPYSAADFRHGPVAVVDGDVPVLAVATDGPTHAEMAGLVEDMITRGAHVIAMTDRDDTPGHAHLPVPRVQSWLSPVVTAPALQLFAHALAGVAGHDPDRPRGLSKVTRTR